MLNNSIYSGTVRHRRYSPAHHTFSYKLFMLCLKLDELETTLEKLPYTSYEKFNWLSFRRKNYIGDKSVNLDNYIKNLLESEGINTAGKSLYLISHLSFFGYHFNPLTLYILCDNSHIETIIVEVHNTPWGEKHCYILKAPIYVNPPVYKYVFKKELHVSPFMTMDFNYTFSFKLTANKIILNIQNIANNKVYFDATLCMRGECLNKKNYLNHIKKHPFMTYKIILAIYWQAFLLWVKGISFVSHPNRKE